MVTQFNRENPVKNLPDAFSKANGSNNDKILQIEKSALEALRKAISELYDSLDLDNAYGYTLDLCGDMVGQERGKATDAQYRVLIKTRIIRNLANGDYNSVVKALALVLDCDPSEIVITETEQPMNVEVRSLPFETLNKLVIDTNTAVKIIKEVLPAGTVLSAVNFSGTFEFSDGTELVYDEAAGFADIEQSYGGYLGAIFDGEAPDLPV